jgi:hypothetical protein
MRSAARWASSPFLLSALLLLVLAINADVLRGSQSLTQHSDNVMGAFPLRLEAARQWKSGRLPLWNPYKRAGSPLLGDILTGALYPGNAPFLFANEGARYRPLEQVALLHSLLGAVLMYAFLRALDIAPLAALLGSLIFVANGAMLWLTSSWIQQQCTMIWLPAILLAVRRIGQGRSLTWILAGGIAVGLQVLAGFPEYAFYGGVIAMAYAVASPATNDSRWRTVAAAATMYVIGIGLAAAQVLPTIELTGLSRRGIHVDLREFLSLAASPAMVLGWLVPGAATPLIAKTPMVGVCYLGAVTVPLLAEGARRLDRRSGFFTILLVVGFILTIGSTTPVAAIAYRIPGFGMFRYPYKHVFEIILAVSVLSAIGADAVLRGRSYSAAFVALLTAVVVAVTVWACLRSSTIATPASAKISIAACLVFLTALATLPPSSAVIAAVAALALTFSMNRTELLASMLDVRADTAESAAADFARTLHSDPPWRYALAASSTPASINSIYREQYLSADFPTQFEVPAVHGCCPFLWTPLGEALGMSDEGTFNSPRRILGESHQILDILSCRWIGGATNELGRNPFQRVVNTYGGFTLAERPGALPPVRFVDAAQCKDPAVTLASLRSGVEDVKTLAFLDCSNHPPPPDANPAVKAATLVADAPGHLVVRTTVEGATPALLVVSQSDFPGWEAHVDGIPSPIYRAYGLIQGVVVQAGAHEVVLDYRPASFRYGAMISLTTIGLIGIAIWWSFHRHA